MRAGITEEAVIPLLLFIVLATFVWLTPAQNDTWWHLRSGQEMWQTRSLLLTERFSHTSYGSELHNHWWLSQLTFYGVHALGGPVLLTLFAGACAFLAVFGSWRLIRGPLELRIALLMFLLVATAPEWAVRPQVISLAFTVFTAYIVLWERLVWLPLLCVVWANVHGMVVFGLVMAGAAVVEAIVWSRSHLKRNVAIAAACAIAQTMSPVGWEYWPQVLRTVSVSRSLNLHEYRPPFDVFSIPFWVAAAALVILAVARRQSLATLARGERVLLAAAGLSALTVIGASRNVAFFAVIAAPALSYLWTLAAATPSRRRPRPAPAGAYVLIALAVLAGVTFIPLRWRDSGVALGWHPLADEAIEAVRRCPDPLFNHLEDGGYLMWTLPERRVFIDSRMEAYPLPLLERSRDADLNGNYSDVFRQFAIRCALVPTGSALHRALVRDASMNVAYSDSQRTVFVRHGGSFAGAWSSR
jgi:hypothetical protein